MKKMIPSMFISGVCNLAVLVYMGFYRLNNPDQNGWMTPGTDNTIVKTCWAGSEIALDPTITNFLIVDTQPNEDTIAPDNLNYNVNVTQNFVAWFEAGFFLYLLSTLGILASTVGIFLAKDALIKFGVGVLSFAQACGGLAWIIAGTVLRWR